jgi:hypothetical protein
MEEKEKKKFNHLKEKIKKTFKRMALTGIMSFSILTSSYSVPMYYVSFKPETFPKYKYEYGLIEKGNRYSDLGSDEDYEYYRVAVKLIKEKQNKVGEGKDMELDFLRVYSVYSMARAPPEPEYAEPYLLEAKELAKRYYEIWKEPEFLCLQAVITETLGHAYFVTAEDIRDGKKKILLLKNSSNIGGIDKNKIVIKSMDLHYFLSIYSVEKIIGSENFTEILHYYIIARKYYEEYLKFYKESRLEETIKDYPNVLEDFKKTNDRVLSNLQTIEEILSKYQKESSTKEEKKEIAEKKNENNNNKQNVKEKKKEPKKEEIDWEKIGSKDIQEGL